MFNTVSDFVSLLRIVSGNTDRPIKIMGRDKDAIAVAAEINGGETVKFVTPFVGEIDAVLAQAIQSGYVFPIDKETFRLTYKGLHPYKSNLWNIFQYVLQSIFVPIVLSVITTLITVRLSM